MSRSRLPRLPRHAHDILRKTICFDFELFEAEPRNERNEVFIEMNENLLAPAILMIN